VSPSNVSLRVFASPHPGSSTFTEAVAAVIPDHVNYRQVNDKVPDVPIALGYAQLPNTIVLQPMTATLEIELTAFPCRRCARLLIWSTRIAWLQPCSAA